MKDSFFRRRDGWRWLAGLTVLLKAIAAPDFTLTVEPSTLTLVPGQQSSLLISVSPLDGFSNQVALATGDLPAGVTGRFSPQTIQPPGASVLTLTAATNAAVGTFSLSVAASGGGMTNTASSSVLVNFGLIKLCTGGFTGVVTDIETGLPVTNASVQSYYLNQPVDSQGVYLMADVPLGDDNAPEQYSLQAHAADYWSGPSVSAYAICQVTNRIDFHLLRQRHGSVSGTVTIAGGSPAEGAAVGLFGPGGNSTFVDATGHFVVTNLTLYTDNSPANYSLNVHTNGYWDVSTNVVVAGNSNSMVNITLLPICTGTVTGQVLLADTLQPATHVQVSVYSGQGQVFGTTDSQGNYELSGVALGKNNTILESQVNSSAPGYFSSTTNVVISKCGESVIAPTLYLNPFPRNNYGAIAGHVYDVVSGRAVSGASINYGVTITDAGGAYLYTNVYIGTGTNTTVLEPVVASAAGYFENSSNVVVRAGVTNFQDIFLLPVGHGGVEGVVRDSATRLPLTNVFVNISAVGSVPTDSQGHYFSGPVPLSRGNQPAYVSLYANSSGYYPLGLSTTVTNGLTNLVNFDLIKICSGATIVGNVVDAASQQPITNATIFVNSGLSTGTDLNGNFILTNITVGNNNSPIQTTVSARAPGYNPQSRVVTIFCGATIRTEFGAPQTALAGIVGYVTNVVTGLPLAGVFIGSEFGEATTTDTNGFYTLNQAPLGANNSSRTWTVTAIPDGFASKTLSVTVSSNSISQLNFGFGEPPAHLQLSETSTPASVTVGSNVVYTVTLQNSGGDAANVQLADTLDATVTFVSASLSHDAGGTFTVPIFTNGIVTATATNLASQNSVVLTVVAHPTTPGAFTNQAVVTSSTPDVDRTGTNRLALAVNTATAPVPVDADLQVVISAAPIPVFVGNFLSYIFVVTNAGPVGAPDAQLDTTFSDSEVIVSTVAGQGSVTRSGQAVHWDLGALSVGGTANLVIQVTPQSGGTMTNLATVTLVPGQVLVVDPNLANNAANLVVPVTAPPPPPTTTNLVILFGGVAFDPQTGLFEQQIEVQNPTGGSVPGFWLMVPGLSSQVVLYNAVGATNGVPYVHYGQTLSAGGSALLNLEYFTAGRQPIVSTNFTVVPVVPATNGAPSGTVLALDRPAAIVNGHLLIEFQATPGATYVVQYSRDMQTWKTAQPPIVAPADRVQWIDSGPPKTESLPAEANSRFYRILQTSSASTPHL